MHSFIIAPKIDQHRHQSGHGRECLDQGSHLKI
jgi:hypothetical protein